jgi:3-phenylpropionate/trans-cinnamate dioxygenase ferredoxin reductase subunit
VVAGAGPAAHGAVTGLRQAGFKGEVVVVGRETTPPYERPALSKRYLLRDEDPERLRLPPVEAELRLGVEVAQLDPEGHRVRLDGGERLGYGRLLLVTGARARALPGYESAPHLRELPDADRLRRLLATGGPLDIVGAGFVGCEVAAAARARGVAVTVHELLAQPLLRVLGPELGEWLGRVHRDHGVALRTRVSRLPPAAATTLVAVGSQPNVELAQAAGIECDAGVVVDELGRTSAPDVYAAGDCARFWSPLFHEYVRVEHFQTASRHGAAVGRGLAGDPRPFAEAPWFWSDQYDLNLQYTGAGLPWDRCVVRGRLGEPPFTAFFLHAGRLRAAVSVNDGPTLSRARRLLELRIHPDVEELADPAFDLKTAARR